MGFSKAKRYLPKSWSDTASFCVFLAGVHAVAGFELFVVLPFVYREEITFTYYIHVVCGLFIYMNVMLNMFKFLTTESGSVGLMLPVVLREGWRFCSACECNAPPRSYHCPLCNKCILKRDHHCSFTGNCVGFANIRYYMHMILFIFIASVYSNVLNFDYAVIKLGGFTFTSALMMLFPILSWLFNVSETYTVVSAFMTSLCLLASLLMAALLFYHGRNMIKGQTVMENTYRITTYDFGWKINLMMAFGRNWQYCWLSPFIPSPLIGNGTQFSNKELFEDGKDI